MDNLQRVYFVGKDGNFYQTKFKSDGSKFTIVNEDNTAPIDPNFIRANGLKVIDRLFYQRTYNFISSNQKSSTMFKDQYGRPFAVSGAETPTGGRRAFREETTGINKARKQINIKLTNTSPTNSHELVVGDHHGLLGDKFGLGQLSYEVTATGTWGNVVLANLKQITGANPYDFHSLHITAKNITLTTPPDAATETAGIVGNMTPSGDFFEGGGFIRLSEAGKADETAIDDEIPFTDGIDGGTYRDNIRKDPNFRFLMDGFSGIHINLPPLTCININTYVNAVARVYGMREIGDACS